MKICKRCIVSGRVQGVFYRGSCERIARSLGITGHARNLPNGRVEVLAWGEAQALEALIEWLWQGPSAARVTAVDTERIDAGAAAVPPSFTTG